MQPSFDKSQDRPEIVINKSSEINARNLHKKERKAKCCNSSTKVKLALIGLGSTTVSSVIALIVHILQCKK